MRLAAIAFAAFFIFAGLAFADITNGLVGHWRFNGDASDSSKFENHGTISAVKGDSRLWSKSLLDQAIKIDGRGTWIDIPYHASLELTDNFSLLMWFKGRGTLVTKGFNCLPRDWMFEIENIAGTDTRALSIKFSDDGASKKSISVIFNVPRENKDWSHAAFVVQAGSASFYLNGREIKSIPLGQNGMLGFSNGLRIGASFCGNQRFNGTIDDVQIYERALEKNEILEIYLKNSGKTVPDTIPPTTPTDLRVNGISPNQIQLSWAASSDVVGVEGYIIYRNGLEHSRVRSSGNAVERFLDIIALSPGTSYRYAISAYDLSGNESEKSKIPVRGSTLVKNPAFPVFPGAQGFGVYTKAGRGGKVYVVNTLMDYQKGKVSLRDCLEAKGLNGKDKRRVCVFEVSGNIHWNSNAKIREPYITVAGQTAPSPGITITGAGIIVQTHDVLIQHIRVRSGDGVRGPKAISRDSISIFGDNPYTSKIEKASNIVIDHVTASWALDENMSTWYPGVRDITVSNSIISEGLYYSRHPKGGHSMGFLVGNDTDRLALIGNLFAHNNFRNPYISKAKNILFVNNAVYNPGGFMSRLLTWGAQRSEISVNFVGNVFIPGPDTDGLFSPVTMYFVSASHRDSRVFVSDNKCTHWMAGDPWACVIGQLSDENIRASHPSRWPNSLAVKPGAKALESVLLNAGARPADRDETDKKIIGQVKDPGVNGRGLIPNCVSSTDVPYGPSSKVQGFSTAVKTIKFNAPKKDRRTPSGYNQPTISAKGYKIRVSGPGLPVQERNIVDFHRSKRIAKVDRVWDTIPDSRFTYQVFLNCSRNAGGWVKLSPRHRKLFLPSNMNGDDDGDGYTNLEEWLHRHAATVEGR